MTLRRAIFWIHLCCGLALAVWACVIGLTGAVVVFQDEITRAQFLKFPGSDERRVATPLEKVVRTARVRHPDLQPITITVPNEWCPFFMTYFIHGPQSLEVYSNARTGEIAGTLNPKGGWLGTVHGWHVNLWGGRSGRLANGYAACVLIVLAITGVILWLPGRSWRLRLREIHFASGIVLAPFVLMFAITATYFVWPGPWLQLASLHEPRLEPPRTAGPRTLALDQFAAFAQGAVSDAVVHRVQITERTDQPVRVTMRRGSVAEFHLVDTVFLDPETRKFVRVDRLRDRPAGDSILAWLSVLHFAAFGGIVGEILWSIAGVGLAVLSVTGCWMWLRRIL